MAKLERHLYAAAVRRVDGDFERKERWLKENGSRFDL